MNVDDKNNSKSPCKVISKYFSSSPVMDESLSEFQKKKSTVKGPKAVQKPEGGKKFTTKSKKQPRKQKDIRTALNTKKNELLTYTKKFDEVCKESGVDIDTEQLQLAIALSKSLQHSNNIENNIEKSLNSKEKVAKIRTTLQEYGFTVPETKIINSKRLHKQKKNYKLLSTSAIEKEQIVSDKYAQVLFGICNQYKIFNNEQYNYSEKKLFYVATSIPYMDMQNNDVLYVDNLIDKSESTGNLLKDWSNIPGRPRSPKKVQFNMNFSEIECSQDEIDVVLSGTLKAAKEVMKNKIYATNSFEDDNVKTPEKTHHSCNDLSYIDTKKSCSKSNSDDHWSNDLQLSATSDTKRSCSPDLFDDDETVVDNSDNRDDIYTQLINSINEAQNKPTNETKEVELISYSSNHTECGNYTETLEIKDTRSAVNTEDTTNVTNKSPDIMEVTNCVKTYIDFRPLSPTYEPISTCSDSKIILQKSETIIDSTKIISNDFMEITECFTNSPSLSNSIDLTQISDEDDLTVTDDNFSYKQKDSCNNAGGNLGISQAIDENDVNKIVKTNNSEDELPFIQISGSNNKSLDDFNDTIILNDNEINDVLTKSPKTINKTFKKIHTAKDEESVVFDLTETSSYCNKENISLKVSQSLFDEFIHNHSNENFEDKTASEDNYEDNKIDLTQSSDSISTESVISSKFSEPFDNVSKKSIGKKDNVSIDYDDLYDVVLEKSKNNYSRNNISQQSDVFNASDDNVVTNSKEPSENSEVFEICDQEFNYSLNMSRPVGAWDNFGGLSVMDNVSEVETHRNTDCNLKNKSIKLNNATTLSSLSVASVNKSNKDDNHMKTSIDTPQKDLVKVKAVAETPSNDYIIKTDQVTPMLDYSSMSTPERNKELNKYGLKPFKRKRAIQLLTHLYNQTHPVVQLCSEEQPSPSKRRKQTESPPKQDLVLGFSSVNPLDNKENLYELTKDLPDIKSIECSEEDWVFQKREKAKIHTCRVPLHIAFHNYVYCRQRLREAILKYEPVNIDVIHKDLVSQGHRYDPKDLLKFLDKKCITVKTADTARNNKKH